MESQPTVQYIRPTPELPTFASSAMIRTLQFFHREQEAGSLSGKSPVHRSGSSPRLSVHHTVRTIRNYPGHTGSVFTSRAYFLALEEGGPENVVYRYVCVHDGDELIGVFHFQLIPVNRKNLLSRIRDRPYHRLFSVLSKMLDLLLCNNLVSSRKNVLLISGNACITGPYGHVYQPGEEKKVGSCLNDALSLVQSEAESAFKIIGIVSKDYPEGHNPHRKLLSHRRFMRLHMDPVMSMAIRPEWRALIDYAQTLSSKYRMRFNKALKKIEKCEWNQLDEEAMRTHRKVIENLYVQVQENAPLRLVDNTASYLIALKKHLKKEVRFMALFDNGHMLAFITAIRNGEEMEAHHIGFDYKLNMDYSLYLNILYSYIGLAIEMQCRSLCFGRTAMEIKSTVGAVPSDFETHLRLENPVLNSWVRWMLPDGKGRQNWILRNPFR